jgi:predicted O-methyltransferase YrrM
MIHTPEVERYLATVRPPVDGLLAEMEAHAEEHDVPIADRETAALIALLVRATGAVAVLEVGLAIGYTAVQAARALPEDGRVVTLESDASMIAAAEGYLARDPAGKKVRIVAGDARETMRGLVGPYDLIYIDADKASLSAYVDLALERLRPAGLIVVDNLLMAGRAATGEGDAHWAQRSVDAARALSRRLSSDPALAFVLLPVGDGVGVVQRREP